MFAHITSITKLGELGCNTNITNDALNVIRSDYANWIIPGRVMCGPYPGLDGGNFPDKASAEQNLKSLLADGIDCFVCLQEEIFELDNNKPHPYFPKYENYKNTLGQIAGVDVSSLRFLHLPIRDQCVPDKNVFMQQMAQLAEAYTHGHKIYIHCAGGHGRTGVFACCLLLALFRMNKGVNADYIMQFVQYAHDRRRIQDKRVHHMLFVQSPNTAEQRALVTEFSNFLKFL